MIAATGTCRDLPVATWSVQTWAALCLPACLPSFFLFQLQAPLSKRLCEAGRY